MGLAITGLIDAQMKEHHFQKIVKGSTKEKDKKYTVL